MISKLEIYSIALVVLLAVICGAYFKGHHSGYQSARDEFAAAALKQAEQSRTIEQAERDKLLNVSTDYEKQIAQIKVDAASRPARVVRLCDAATTSLPQATGTAGESVSQAPSQSGSGNGIDIGSRLRDYSERYQACAIEVNALIEAWPR